jgi:hypothetical protein
MKMRKPSIEFLTWIVAAVAAFTTTVGDAATGADSGVGVVAEYRPGPRNSQALHLELFAKSSS